MNCSTDCILTKGCPTNDPSVLESSARARSDRVRRVVEMRTDCDQDAIWIRVEQSGAACHTGRRSCFYRKVDAGEGGALLSFADANRLFDPT